MHYQGGIDFAGTVTLVTAWLLSSLQKRSGTALRGRKGAIATWRDGEVQWVGADLSTMPPWHHQQLTSVQAVEALTFAETKHMEHTMV